MKSYTLLHRAIWVTVHCFKKHNLKVPADISKQLSDVRKYGTKLLEDSAALLIMPTRRQE